MIYVDRYPNEHGSVLELGLRREAEYLNVEAATSWLVRRLVVDAEFNVRHDVAAQVLLGTSRPTTVWQVAEALHRTPGSFRLRTLGKRAPKLRSFPRSAGDLEMFFSTLLQTAATVACRSGLGVEVAEDDVAQRLIAMGVPPSEAREMARAENEAGGGIFDQPAFHPVTRVGANIARDPHEHPALCPEVTAPSMDTVERNEITTAVADDARRAVRMIMASGARDETADVHAGKILDVLGISHKNCADPDRARLQRVRRYRQRFWKAERKRQATPDPFWTGS